jgi:hypothetical protein
MNKSFSVKIMVWADGWDLGTYGGENIVLSKGFRGCLLLYFN